MFKGSQEQQAQQRPQEGSSHSWYPPSVVSSPSSSRPTTPSSSASNSFNLQRPAERPHSPTPVSPAEAAGIIALLKDKSVDELRKLLSDKDAYNQFLLSVDQVKIQNNNFAYCLPFCTMCNVLGFWSLKKSDGLAFWPWYKQGGYQDSGTLVAHRCIAAGAELGSHKVLIDLEILPFLDNFYQIRDELRKETLQLARNNLDKEPRIMELRNQCRIIRTTELATAQEKLNELERQKEEILKYYSPASFIHRLQDAMNETEEELEALHRQLLDREMDLGTFVQKYKKLRTTYHRRALIHLAAKTSPIG
ncbi:hypothetical protein SCA6_001792 [Theobroma cacao]